MTGRHVLLALLCSALLAALTATPARSASAWLPSTDLASSGSEAPQIVFDDAGNATAIWKRRDGFNSNVETASHLAGGSWSAPEVLALSKGTDGAEPQIAVDKAGNAIAIWVRVNETDQMIVETARRAAGGAWSAPEQLSPPSQNAAVPQIAMNGAGNAIAVWLRHNGTLPFTLESARYSIDSGWSGFQDLPAVDPFQPQVAIDDAGRLVAVWVTEAGVIESSASASNGWTSPIVLSDAGQFAIEPRVAVDGAGNAVAIWTQNGNTNFSLTIKASRLPLGGAWSQPETLSPPDVDSDSDLDSDWAGNAVAIWGIHGTIQSSAFIGNAWTAPLAVSGPRGSASAPQVSIGEAGNAIAGWHCAVWGQSAVKEPSS